MTPPHARQIGNMAVRAFLHRLGGTSNVDVAIVLLAAASAGAAGNTLPRQFTAAQRGLAVLQVDAMRLERRGTQTQAEAAKWQARAELALRAGNASLARQALARKRHVQRIVDQYADEQTAQHRALDHVRAVVEQ